MTTLLWFALFIIVAIIVLGIIYKVLVAWKVPDPWLTSILAILAIVALIFIITVAPGVR